MERLDVFYKAYDAFRTMIEEDSETPRFRKFCAGIKSAKAEELVVSYSTVEIKEDWVNALEKGLVYVEKAIKEDRQFIRNEGEVIPIEKVRRTSKAGIQDLAKHSNYITHTTVESSDSSVIPDKMLMIQREADYSIYENRVIYAMLVYLKDFITVRLQKIKDLTNSFEFEAFENKDIEFGDKKIQYSLNIHEIRKNDPVMCQKNSARDTIDRLDKCFTLVMSFLKTPLMNEVSKAELVSRPITKTNVLRMNTNFRESLALFDFIAEYQGDGFTIKKVEKKFNPFSLDHKNSMTDIIALTSFVTYMYGNNLADELKENLKKKREEDARKEQERILKSLHSFELKGKANKQTIEQYFEDFVKGYKIIEKKCLAYEDEIENQKNDFIKQMNEQKFEFDKKLIDVNTAHEEELEKQKDSYEKQIADKDEEHRARIEDLNEEHRSELATEFEKFNKKLATIADPLNEKISELSEDKSELERRNKYLSNKIKELESALFATDVSNHAAPREDSYGAKDDFNHLEILKENFDAYFKRAWNETKKTIRNKNLRIDKDYKKTQRAKEQAKKAREARLAKQKEKEKLDEENLDESGSEKA